MRVFLFVLCLFLLGRPVGVAQAAESILVFPPGLDSCQVWTQGRIQTGVAQLARQAWVLGFVTAANAYTQTYGYGDGNLTKGTDAEGLYAWIDNFCIANPFNGLSSATTAMTNDLLARN